ncbi:hypothetical protein ACFSKN_05655 [Mariniflexile gromovii]|uniref:SGNH/GDSL hydrolase family protein n=1 Tax=Mariniflexile gromovii TaxID=362523 RepID=A0ABS4BTL1_9FLAO|nr:hypothetical protein [Mariniflexile gromovii]MBP0903930.1 hypothetical protein [Mariniflexile gromovii]
MQLKQSLLMAIALSVISLGAWELYWRSQGKTPNLDDNKDLWAVQRAKGNKATADDVILTGSSRVLFDIQLNEWEKETGIRPIQLATAGASPLPIFSDIVNNTNFKGTVLVGVTPPLFFSTTYPLADPWYRAQNRTDYFQKRTYAQRFNHLLSIPLQKNLALISTSEEKWNDNFDLKTLINNIRIGERIPQEMPPFYRFDNIDLDRNVEMTPRTVNDTAFANTHKKVWGFFGKVSPPPDKKSTMDFFVNDAKKFMERGGKIILLRCPSTGGFRMGEKMVTPRAEFWDKLVDTLAVPSYHFEDYEPFKNLDCPEWSHLSAKDARFFTTELVKILKADGALTKSKTN